MTSEDSPVLTRKTWARSIEPVVKIGYMDGASDGQHSVYQQSFDVGYEQGFNFGLHLGLQSASTKLKEKSDKLDKILLDPRKINCHICINQTASQGNVVNLYNTQKERNLGITGSKSD